MSESAIGSIVASYRLRGREEFHRHFFELMLGGAWRRQVLSLTPTDEKSLLTVLSRWIREAPFKDELDVLRMLVVRSTVRNLIESTEVRNRQFLMDVLEVSDEELAHPNKLSDRKRIKLAVFGDATVFTPDSLSEWTEIDPATAILAAVVSLDVCTHDTDFALNTAAIGRWLVQQAPVKMPIRYLQQLQSSAFSVSYLTDEDKHSFKRAIVLQAMFMLNGLHIPLLELKQSKEIRPRLTIIGEMLFPQHAMFRCYAEQLADLKKHFKVTLIADEYTRCNEHELFSHSKVYFQPSRPDIAGLAHLVKSTQPDIILYPSIGMTYWTFALSMLRLARLQLMAVGHPAPCCSDQIDGTLVYRELATVPLNDFGKIITFDFQTLPLPPIKDWNRTEQFDRLVVAVNAAFIKLTSEFLDIIEAAMQEAPTGTELHFYPNVLGDELLAIRSMIHKRFKSAYVHPATNYAEYMGQLCKSSIIIQSFPFGGTNTTIDALAAGIPIVCLAGDELPSQVDPLLLKRAGLSELCAKDKDDFLKLITRFLSSTEERERIRVQSQASFELLREQKSLGDFTMADAILQTWKNI